MDGFCRTAAELGLGWACAGCGEPGVRLCPGCLARFAVPRLIPEASCLVPVAAAGAYAGVARPVLTGYKLGGMWSLARPLGWCLARAVVALEPPRRVLLVPVPSAPVTVRTRGLDTTRALARGAARALRAPGVAASVRAPLRQRRGVREQVGLTARQRRVNLSVGLTVRRPDALAGSTVVVVDDILTTGATADGAVRALLTAGVTVHGVAVLAHTPAPAERSGPV